MLIRRLSVLLLALLCAACGTGTPGVATNQTTTIQEVSGRAVIFRDYPQPGRTYLSFSAAHGYQVNYLADGGRAWLWYPGNRRGVPEEYKRDIVAGQDALCWRHPGNSYNPVTARRGGGFSCTPLEFARKTIIAVLAGDPFNLASGTVPYRLNRCRAPDAFNFDRARFGC